MLEIIYSQGVFSGFLNNENNLLSNCRGIFHTSLDDALLDYALLDSHDVSKYTVVVN